MLVKLLAVRWALFRNTLTRGETRDRRRALSGIAWSAVMLLVVGTLGLQFFTPLADFARADAAVEGVLVGLPALALFTAFWMLLLSGLTVGIQSYYLNPELPLLLSAPVRARTVFYAKFVEATIANTGLFLVIGAPLFIAYAMARDTLSPDYVVRLVLGLVAFCSIPSGLGSAAVMALMRVLPANRTRDLLAALGVALFAALYVGLSLGVRSAGDMESLHQTTRLLAAALDRPILHAGPWAWAAMAVTGDGRSAQVWSALGLLWFVAAATLWLTGSIAARVHLTGWAMAQEVGAKARTVRVAGSSWEGRLTVLPAPMRAVFLKDMRSLWRDMRQLSLFLIPIAVVVVFLFQVRSTSDVDRVPSPVLAQMLYPVLAMIAMRLSMSAFMTEGRALWLLLASPNDPRAFLAGKFAYAYTLSMAISAATTAVFGALRGVTGWDWLVDVALMACAVAGFCGIGVGAGVVLCDFSADNARFAMSPGGRLLTFVLQMGYLAVLTLTTLVAWYLVRAHFAPVVVCVAAGAVVLGATAGAIGVPMTIGARRLRTMEW